MRAALALALLLLAGAGARAQDATGTLDVRVQAAEGDVPLQNARLSLAGAGREGLTNDEGRLVFADVPAGTWRLRVQRIGYVPQEVDVVVRPGERTTRDIRLAHVVVQLTGVRVVTFPPCRKPGVPSRQVDPVLVSLLQQLQLNGDQYRYLVDSLPFSYIAERTSGTVSRSGERTTLTVDTIAVHSNRNGWRYRAGRVVTLERSAVGGRELAMNLPTLDDFASTDFLRNHCFYFSGVERADSLALVRIDFRAADRLRSPDVHGAIWLDSATFTIRRAELELSRLPQELRGADAVTVRTTFVEWKKAVPIIDRVDGETVLQNTGSGRTIAANTETHRLLQVVEHERPTRKRRD